MDPDSTADPHDDAVPSSLPVQGPSEIRSKVPWVATAAMAAGVFLVDLLTKIWAVEALTLGQYVPIVGRFFGFQLIFNPGAAFSFAAGATWIFTVIAVVVSVVIIRLFFQLRSWWWAVTLSSLLGGTLGNLADRLFREPGFGVGHVVDFLNYNGFFVGNAADIFIVVAAAGIAILGFKGISYGGPPPAATSVSAGDAAGSEKPDQ